MQAAAREANLLIDRRAFSWTDLFNRFEETLPADVRIVGRRSRRSTTTAACWSRSPSIARRSRISTTFIDQLEETRRVQRSASRGRTITQEDGTLRSVIQGYYTPAGGAAAVRAAGV